MQVGDVVRLTLPVLGNPVGAIGICYDTYVIGDHFGASFIFPNGNYDGFSVEEQAQMLQYIGHQQDLAHYKFTNVMQLSRDYSTDLFTSTFRDWENRG